jgi:tetratricopeptide (TPR) repeat protein
MRGSYTAPQAAKLLGLSVGRLRSFVRNGFLLPERGARGKLEFSFQDLVLLRTAKELIAQKIAPRRVRAALRRLRDELPSGRPLSAVSIAADGGRIVVFDGRMTWNPESGQQLFRFDVADLAKRVKPLAERSAREARGADTELRAEDWYQLGCELETSTPAEARDAYRRAIELDPRHADAHTNLGRLLHEAGELTAAEAHYRLALEARPSDVTAAFDLGVVLEDRGRPTDAIEAYELALDLDAECADAHYNLARLYERLGRATAAVRHLKIYRKLVRGS